MNNAPILFPEQPSVVENPYRGRVGRPPWLRLQLLTVLKTRGPLPLGTLAKTCKRKPSRLKQPLQALRADGWVELQGDDWQIREAA